MHKPNLFIVGAPKCGTTAWVEYLRSHPDIFFPHVKEPHYFSRDFSNYGVCKTLEDYLALFAGRDSTAIVGEASVWYLYSEVAAKNIKEFNPDSRIIILLRDQEEYLPSLHNQLLYNGDEVLRDFGLAWQLSDKRDRSNTGWFCRDPKFLDYKACGRFSEQVARYYDQFSEQQIRVFHYRDWTSTPLQTYREILRFLDLQDDGRTDFPPVNEAKGRWLNALTPWLRRPSPQLQTVARKLNRWAGLSGQSAYEWISRVNTRRGYKSPISAALKQQIRHYYSEDNAELESLIHRY